MRIYVATSWKNTHHKSVVHALRGASHEVYDFTDSAGFKWQDISPTAMTCTRDEYVEMLKHPKAVRGFRRDMDALVCADACVYIMPCGVSASLELGYAVGAGKKTIVYVPELREPDLMVKMANHVVTTLDEVLAILAVPR